MRVLTATPFAAERDIVLATGSSVAPGCAVAGVRLFTRCFFSVTRAGVASSSVCGVSSATAAGFSLVSVGISTLGPDVCFIGRCLGVAFTVTEGSKSVGEVASWARANCDPANATLLHRTDRRIPLWKHIKKWSAAFRPAQSRSEFRKLFSPFRNPLPNSQFLILPSSFLMKLAFVTFFSAVTLACAADVSITQDELVRRTQELYDAVVPGNQTPWKKYFAEDCIFADEKGRVFDKPKLIADITPLPAGYSGTIKIENAQSRIIGTTAIL